MSYGGCVVNIFSHRRPFTDITFGALGLFCLVSRFTGSGGGRVVASASSGTSAASVVVGIVFLVTFSLFLFYSLRNMF